MKPSRNPKQLVMKYKLSMLLVLVTWSLATACLAAEAARPNLLFGPSDTWKPGAAAKFTELKTEISRLQKEFRDDGQYADPATWPNSSADVPFDDKAASGTKTVAEAITLSGTR